MEGLWETEQPASFSLFAIHDQENRRSERDFRVPDTALLGHVIQSVAFFASGGIGRSVSPATNSPRSPSTRRQGRFTRKRVMEVTSA